MTSHTGRTLGSGACAVLILATLFSAGVPTPGVASEVDRPAVVAGDSVPVDLDLEPVDDLVYVGEFIDVRLVARSSTEVTQDIQALIVLLSWDAAGLELVELINDGPYAWSFSFLPDDSAGDGLNNSLTDGDARYDALQNFTMPAMATPEGLHVTTFRFRGVAPTESAALSIPAALGATSLTQVLGPGVNNDITGLLGSATVRVCPGMPGDDDGDGVENCLDLCPGTAAGAMVNIDGCSCGQVDCDDGEFCNGLESCLGGICQPGTPPCDDGIECTADVCDELQDVCTYFANNGACQNGLFCDGNEICDDTQGCVPGMPPLLDDGVDCTVDTCDEEEDVVMHTPDDGACDDGVDCTVDTCDAVEGCVHTPDDAACDDGIGCTVDSCDAMQGCIHTADDTACDNGLFCDGVESCNSIEGCVDGVDPCEVPLRCDEENDACVECLTDGQCDDGMFCNGAESCIDGACVAGTPPVLDDGIECTVDTCDEENDVVVHTPDDGACNDEVDCTVDGCDVVEGCVNTPDDTACDNGLYCDGVESCNSVEGCVDGVDPCEEPLRCDEENDACVECLTDGQCDDGMFCNGAESCLDGACVAGTPPVLDDGVACTVDTCDEENDIVVHTPDDGACNDEVDCTVDSCDVVEGCINTPDDAACDNGLFCDGVETCDAVEGCVDSADPCEEPLRCDEEKDVCVECLTDEQCDDGLFCNGAEFCLDGACVAGTPPVLDDGVECTVDTCDEENDIVVHTPDDGACNDEVDCTVDSCDVVEGCINTPDDAACDNGLFCDGVESCDAVEGCVDGADPCEEPLRCDEENDDCVECLTDGQCDDGMFCNGAESCVDGNCVDGTPPALDDGIDCTVDTCDEENDVVVHTPEDGACDDGIDCTVDTCDVAEGCINTPDDSSCDNGLFCDGVESCDAVEGCVDGADPCEEPLRCDEENDACVECLTDGQCDDGMFCNGAESCVDGACVAGTPPALDDGVECTVDTCDEVNDVVVHTPDDGACDDGIDCTVDTCEAAEGCVREADDGLCDNGLFCDGEETCDNGLGCVGGERPCDKNVPYCNEEEDTCVCLAGDGNGDGLVNLADVPLLIGCMTGPVGSPEAPSYGVECRCFDINESGSIDLVDAGRFQGLFDGS